MERTGRFNYLLIFLGGMLLYLLAVLPFLVYHRGIFFYYGDYNVQQVPFYILAHRAARSGNFFWNSHIDLGSSMGESMSFYLWGSPFFWLTVPFPESWVPYLMPFVMSLKYGTAMTASYAWIQTQTKSRPGAVIGALLYTFSGFSAANIVFQHFHEAIAFFPLYLITLDRFVQKKKRTGFTLMTALMSIVSYYFFFGQVIFMIVYYLVRYSRRKPLKRTLIEIVQLIFAGALGLLLSAFFLVQSIPGVSGNTRLDNWINGYDILAYPDSTTPLAILKSLFMVPDLVAKGTLFTSDAIKNSSPAAYLPVFSLSGVFAFCAVRKHSWKKTLMILCGVTAFIPVLNSIFSAFNSSYYSRWFYMPILIMAAMTAQALEEARMRQLRKWTVITVCLSVLFMLCALLPVQNGDQVEFLTITDNMDLLGVEIVGTLITFPVLLYVVFFRQPVRLHFSSSGIRGRRKSAACGLASGMVVFLVAVCCVVTHIAVLYNGNSLISWTGGVKWQKQLLTDAPDLPDDSEGFYRVETDNTSTNYDMVWGHPSIRCFESTVNPSIFTFYRTIGMIRTVESSLPIERAGARAILSMRYYLENNLVTPSKTLEQQGGIIGYERRSGTSDGYIIYENTHYIPMGFTYDSYISEENYDRIENGVKSDRVLVKDIILTPSQIRKYGDLMSEDAESYTEAIDDQTFLDLCDERAQSACTEFSFNNDGFTATADLQAENLLFFSVPYDRGFTAYIDGKETEIEKVDGGLMAIDVPQGEHEIEFIYRPYGLTVGIAISAAAAVFLIVREIVWRNRKRRKN